MQKRFFRIIVLGLFLGVVFTACDKPPCDDSDGVQANLGFYKVQKYVYKDTTFKNLEVVTLDNPSEPLKYVLSSTAKSIYLPLSKMSDTSIFILKFNAISWDTISFYYNKELKLESHECGFDFFFHLTKVVSTNHMIDSVWIRKELIEYGTKENVKIFF
jgi:hypothetical protein